MHILVTRRDTDWFLKVSTDLLNDLPSPDVEYRTSPIYLARQGQDREVDLRATPFIGFFCYHDSYEAIARALNNDKSSATLCYGNGLCGLVCFADSIATLEGLKESAAGDLRASEYWRIKEDGKIEECGVYLAVLNEPLERIGFPIPGSLSNDLQQILTEFLHGWHKGVAKAAQFRPAFIPMYTHLASAMRRNVAELIFLSDPATAPPSFIRPNDADSLRVDEKARQRRLNLLTDLVIQINSALSYVASQAFSGTPPILSHESLYQKHSLLGIGSAVAALDAITSDVVSIFSRYPVHKAIDKEYRLLPFDGVGRCLQDYDQRRFDWPTNRIDKYLGTKESELKPHLVFFSGRLGFQESHFAVSAAMQAIDAAYSARWSLMTLTHELIHAHVRSLLSVIFRTDPGELDRAGFQRFYTEYLKYVDKQDTPQHRISSLRFVIFNFCAFQTTMLRADGSARTKKADSRSEAFPVHPMTSEKMHEKINDFWKHINEIIVHTLDFQYLYDGSASLYVPLLWKSWATVPAVIEHLFDYLLRTVVTIASDESGTIENRFSQSLRQAQEQLDEIMSEGDNNLLIREALGALRDDATRKRLRRLFEPSLYLADATMSFLKSHKIHAALTEHGSLAGGDSLATGTWVTPTMSSAVALVTQCLHAALHDPPNDDEGPRSAWLFQACAAAATTRPELEVADD